jgi:hypothetical protein
MKYLQSYNESTEALRQVKIDLTQDDLDTVLDIFQMQIADIYKMIYDEVYSPNTHLSNMMSPSKDQSVYTCYYNKHNQCIEIVINKSENLNNIQFNKDMKLFKERVSKFGFIVFGHASSYKFTGNKKYFVVIFKPMFSKKTKKR